MDYDTALRTYNQFVAAKVAKGYTPGQDGTPYQHTGQRRPRHGHLPAVALNPLTDTYALGLLLIRSALSAPRKSSTANA